MNETHVSPHCGEAPNGRIIRSSARSQPIRGDCGGVFPDHKIFGSRHTPANFSIVTDTRLFELELDDLMLPWCV